MSETTPELEAVARAIFEAEFGDNYLWEPKSSESKEPWYRKARAALSALLPPSEGMIEAVAQMDDDGSGEWEDSFTASIQHVLGGE